MDQQTVNYYDKEASKIARLYNSVESPIQSLIPFLFHEGDKILDIGCGGGRDTALMVRNNLDAYGVDPSEILLSEAEKRFTDLSGRLFQGDLLDLPKELPTEFNHVLLSAVIMHIPDNELFSSAFALRNILSSGGSLIISHCPKREGLTDCNRDENGRLFILRSSEQISLLFEGLGFQRKHLFQSIDSMGRDEIYWETLVFEKTGTLKSESVDRIESIINNDRKTATYKLALLRALCELAQKDPLIARWNNSGKVEVPLRSIADKWLEYYFLLIGNKTFVPQNRGETPNSKKPISFRKKLSELNNLYDRSSKGLTQFIDDRDMGRFDKRAEEVYKDVIKKITEAIKNGPVVYCSGNVFKYESDRKTVAIEGSLWRELVLLGHWIEDSLILKWAHLINEFSRSTTLFPVNRALELLITEPDFERRVGPARNAFSGKKEIHCVWSDRSLTTETLVIDHAIPFALRHDNSLWNLMPADNKVNLSKSDKLPTSDQLIKSRDGIIYSWDLLYRNQKELFSAETTRFLGVKNLISDTWEIDLFNAFFQTVESIANRRGIERWEW